MIIPLVGIYAVSAVQVSDTQISLHLIHTYAIKGGMMEPVPYLDYFNENPERRGTWMECPENFPFANPFVTSNPQEMLGFMAAALEWANDLTEWVPF